MMKKLIVITPSHQSKTINIQPIKIGNCSIMPTHTARNLRATFYHHMSPIPHVSSIIKSCNFQLRRLLQIRKYLSTDASEKLIHAFISSRLDNGNSLVFGVSDYHINRLQRVHNTAARILTQTSKYEHITPVLKSLHWHPIKQRIILKILILVYRCLHGLGPSYLTELLVPYSPARLLRSSDSYQLQVPKSKKKSLGDRSFMFAGPMLWNKLPISIRKSDTLLIFKSSLKYHLFKESYQRTWTFSGKCAI